MSLIQDPDLIDVLSRADPDDLGILIDHITDKGQGRISLANSLCAKLTAAKDATAMDEEVRALIAEELQRYGGNSFANLFRGGSGVSYREVVKDVADHAKADYESTDCASIEVAIVARMLELSFDKMSEQQRKELFDSFGMKYAMGPAALAALLAAIRLSGLGTYQMATLVANATVKAMLGRGLALGAQAGLMRGIGAMAGPIGWAITAIWTAFDLASPAYRITVPCVIQIAYMRLKAAGQRCSTCGTVVVPGARFCGDCGAAVGSQKSLASPDQAQQS